MKNCEPLALGPALAMESTPGPSLQILVEFVVELVAGSAVPVPLGQPV